MDEVVARLRLYAEAGVERVFLQHLDHADIDLVRLIGAEVAPALHEPQMGVATPSAVD